MPAGSLESRSAFRRGPDGRLMGADDRFGSGGDCDPVKNITKLNGRYGDWLFETDE